MPRNTRNFWLDLSVDGRSNDVATGPAAKDGGFHLSIAQRADDDVTYPVRVTGRSLSTGQNIMEIDAEPVGDSSGKRLVHVEVWRGGRWVRVRSRVSIRIVSER